MKVKRCEQDESVSTPSVTISGRHPLVPATFSSAANLDDSLVDRGTEAGVYHDQTRNSPTPGHRLSAVFVVAGMVCATCAV